MAAAADEAVAESLGIELYGGSMSAGGSNGSGVSDGGRGVGGGSEARGEATTAPLETAVEVTLHGGSNSAGGSDGGGGCVGAKEAEQPESPSLVRELEQQLAAAEYKLLSLRRAANANAATPSAARAALAPSPAKLVLPEDEDDSAVGLWSQHESEQHQVQQLKAELSVVQMRTQCSTHPNDESRSFVPDSAALPPLRSPAKLTLPVEDEADASGKWNVLAWTRGAGFHRVVAAALQKGMTDQGFGNDSDAALKFIRGLKAQGEIDSLLRTEEVMGALSDLLWSATGTLQRAGAATSEEIQGKFAGSIELSYSGLDTFFGGLESVVGSPDPNLRKTMEDEHTKRADAGQEFTTRYAAPLPAHSAAALLPPPPRPPALLPPKAVARSAPQPRSLAQ